MAAARFGGDDFDDSSGSDSDDENGPPDMNNNFLNVQAGGNVRNADYLQLFVDSDDDDDDVFFGFQGNLADVPDWNFMRRVKNIDREYFDRQTGPTIQNPPGNGKAIDYFQLFFDDPFLEKIRGFTNLNAERKIERLPDKNKSPWKKIETIAELKAFFAILLYIEKYVGCRLCAVWNNDRDHFMLDLPGVTKVMARNRFLQIFRYLHFCDEDHAREQNQLTDKLYKLKPLLMHMRKTFMENYIPERETSVDECMIPFKGRLGMKQYMKDKPVKWGIKVWMLSESSTGYNYNFEVYVGRNAGEDGRHPAVGLGENVVLTLTEPLALMGYHVYIDQFFTSPTLLYHMLQRRMYVCVTVMPNRRGFPRDLAKTKPQANQMARGPLTGVLSRGQVLSHGRTTA
jgi:hypothetical protein